MIKEMFDLENKCTSINFHCNYIYRSKSAVRLNRKKCYIQQFNISALGL